MRIDDAERSATSPRKANGVPSPLPNRTKAMDATSSRPRVPSVNILSEEGDASTQAPGSTSGSESHNTDLLTASSPPTSMEPDGDQSTKPPQTGPPTIDDQVENVKDLALNMQMTEGLKGFLVSSTWFTRLVSRTTQGLQEGHAKGFREGEIGPIDNKDLVPSGETQSEEVIVFCERLFH